MAVGSDQLISPVDTHISRAFWFVPWMTARIRSSFSLVIWSANIKAETKSQLSIQKLESLKSATEVLLCLGQAVTSKGAESWGVAFAKSLPLALHGAAQSWTAQGRVILLNWFQNVDVPVSLLYVFIQWNLLLSPSVIHREIWVLTNPVATTVSSIHAGFVYIVVRFRKGVLRYQQGLEDIQDVVFVIVQFTWLNALQLICCLVFCFKKKTTHQFLTKCCLLY